MYQIKIAGVALILCGILYQVKPNLFRRGLWMKTSVAIRTLSPEKYVAYMRRVGIIYMVIGLLLLVFG